MLCYSDVGLMLWRHNYLLHIPLSVGVFFFTIGKRTSLLYYTCKRFWLIEFVYVYVKMEIEKVKSIYIFIIRNSIGSFLMDVSGLRSNCVQLNAAESVMNKFVSCLSNFQKK